MDFLAQARSFTRHILRFRSMAIFALCLSVPGLASTKIIYGKDDRQDLYQVTNPFHQQMASSSVALFNESSLKVKAPGLLALKPFSLTRKRKVCSFEPFATQPALAFCSGVLIAKDIVLTAAHCIVDEAQCQRTRFVFDYSINELGQTLDEVSESNVYSCQRIVLRKKEESVPDYAFIQLDREVMGHRPARLSTNLFRWMSIGTPLVMIGNPSGLPTKVDSGGVILDSGNGNYFKASTDSFHGSSGSAVFNSITGEIEGILVNGSTDYVKHPKLACMVSRRCQIGECKGETISRVPELKIERGVEKP